MGRLVLAGIARLDPRGVGALAALAEKAVERGPVLVVFPYLSPSTRERLREEGVSFLDLTGNARLVMSKPGLFIETQGASADPDRKVRPARSLSGPKAGRIVRTLVDSKRLPGVRELAAATRVDAGYVSRVLSFLDSEALITRGKRGRLENVDWPALLRRWAREAPLDSRGDARSFLEPRGLSSLLARVGEDARERGGVAWMSSTWWRAAAFDADGTRHSDIRIAGAVALPSLRDVACGIRA